MTISVQKVRFEDLLRTLPERAAFLAEHACPALLLEPFGESRAEASVDTPTDQLAFGQTTNELLTAPQTHTGFKNLVHPKARVVWLEKSDRNPFAGMVTLGRARNNDLVVPSQRISKMHAIFHQQTQGWLVEDRASTNGTFLDGERLPPNARRPVNDGAQLAFADVIVARFFEADSFWGFCQLAKGQGFVDDD